MFIFLTCFCKNYFKGCLRVLWQYSSFIIILIFFRFTGWPLGLFRLHKLMLHFIPGLLKFPLPAGLYRSANLDNLAFSILFTFTAVFLHFPVAPVGSILFSYGVLWLSLATLLVLLHFAGGYFCIAFSTIQEPHHCSLDLT